MLVVREPGMLVLVLELQAWARVQPQVQPQVPALVLVQALLRQERMQQLEHIQASNHDKTTMVRGR